MSQEELKAYFQAQHSEMLAKMHKAEQRFQTIKSFKPGPNPVRNPQPHNSSERWDGSGPGTQPVSWRPSINYRRVPSPRNTDDGHTFVVTTLADTDDGVCDSDCSLREAIYAANDSPGADIITFTVSGTIQLVTSPPYMTDPAGLTIDGSGGQVTLQGYGSNSTSGILTDVAFTSNGPAAQDSECDPYYSEGPLDIVGATIFGCGIYSAGPMTITGSTLIDSSARSESTLTILSSHLIGSYEYSVGSQTITDSDASGIAPENYSESTLDVENSSFIDGFNYSEGAQTVTGSNFSGNSFVYSQSTLDIENSSFIDSESYSEEAQIITNSHYSDNGYVGSNASLTVNNSPLTNTYLYSGGAQTVTGCTLSEGSDIYSGTTLNIENSSLTDGYTYNQEAQTVTDSDFSRSDMGSGSTFTVTNGVFFQVEIYARGEVTIHSDDTLALVNSTFSGNYSGNFAFIGEPTAYLGGQPSNASSSFSGSFVHSDNTLTVNSAGNLTSTNNTFSGSSLGSNAGLYLYNTILANGSTCGRSVNAGNNNLLESSGGCGLTDGANGNIVGQSAQLGALTGYPAYFPLKGDSPAIDAGNDSICAAPPVNNIALNGLPRTVGDSCDIGAYEASVVLEAASYSSGGDACYGAAIAATQGTGGDPINTRTGGYEYTVEDLSIPTAAGALTFRRDYTSLTVDSPTSLGPGWTDDHEARLIFPDDPGGQPGAVLFKARTANQYTYYDNGDGTYSAAPGLCATLVRQAGPPVRFVVTNAGGDTYTFDGDEVLLAYADAQGNAWNYSHDSAGRLTQVSADGGAVSLSLGYDGAGRIASVSDQTGRSVHFGYDAAGDLSTATDVLGQDWTYGYDSNHLLTQVTDPDGKIVERTEYDAQGRAVRQYDGAGNLVVGLTYNTDPGDLGASGITTITDALGNSETHTYDNRNALGSDADALGGTTSKDYDFNFRPQSITDPAGHATTLAWSADGIDLTGVTDAAGNQTRINYDSLHNPRSMNDPLGYRTSFTYNGKLLASSTDALNGKTTYTYTPEGFLESVTDPLGNTTSYTYDSHGQRASMTDPLGNIWTYAYDALGHQTDTTDPLGRVTHNEYDAAGRVTRTVRNYDPGRPQNDENQWNIVTEYQYDARGDQTAVTDTFGNTTQYVYDDAGRLTQTVDPEGHTTTNTYNEAGQLISTTDPNGDTTQYGYDAAGRQVSVTDAQGHMTHTAYNPDGTVASTTDALDRVTRYQYDELGRVAAVTDPLGGVTHSQYDADGNLIASTDPNGHTTQYEYDALGRQIKQTDPEGGVTEIFYDEAGNRIQTVDPEGIATTYGYDDANRLVSVTNARGAVTRYEYDDLGRRTAVVDANGSRTTYTYDELDRVVAVTDPLDRTTETTYDALGRTLTSTDGNGNATSYAYDALGRQTSQTDPAGGQTSYTYDSNGNRLSVTDPNGHTSQTAYDALNRAISQTDPLGNVTSTVYDAAGQAVSTTDADGKTTAFGYDGLGRQVSVTDPLGNSTHSDYDPAGNLVASTDANGVVTRYEYDGVNRLTAVVENYRPGLQPNAEVNVRTEYTYDKSGNRTAIRDANGHATTFTYNSFGLLQSETDPLGTFNYAYDGANRMVARYNSNGSRIYSYDPAGEITHINYGAAGASSVDVAFGYDDAGRRISMTDDLGTTTWNYDDLNHPTSITDPFGKTVGYGYDAAGNRTGLTYPDGKQVSYQYNSANELTSVTDWNSRTTSYQYDPLGRLLDVLRPNGVDSSYTYDAAGRLTQLQHALSGDTLSSFQYTYDPNGNRTQAIEVMQGAPLGPTVNVTVTSSNGTPLAGKTVYAFTLSGTGDGDTYTNHSKVTDANGQAAITLPAGSYRFRVDVDGTQFWSGPEDHCTIGQCGQVTMTIPDPVLVSVQDSDGTPMPDLHVYAFNDTTYTNYSGTTDSNGQVSLRLPEGNYRFRADLNGTQFWSNDQNDCRVPLCTLDSVSVSVPVTVSVTDDLDMPLSGVKVYAFNGATYTNYSATTDSDGGAAFTLPPGNYRFRADYNPQGSGTGGTQFWSADQNDCTVASDGSTCRADSVRVSLPVTVTVQDTDGASQADVQVYAFDGATYTNYHAATDSDGQAVLTLPPGNYRFRADYNGTQFWSADQNNCAVPGCISDTVTVTTGVVVTVQDTDGTAKSGLNVYAFSGSTYTNFHGVTDEDGHVTFTLPAGNYRFRADLNGTKFWSSTSNDCTIPSCTSDEVIVTIPVAVSVQNWNGTPGAGAHVYAFNGSTYTNYSGTTDSNGQVVLTLPQGDYRFRADVNGAQYWSSTNNNCTVPGCISDTVTIPTQSTATPVPSATPTQGNSPTPTSSLTPTPANTATPVPSSTPTATETSTATPETPTQSGFQPDSEVRIVNANGRISEARMMNAKGRMNAAFNILHSALQEDVTVTVLDTDSAPQTGLPVYAFDGTTYTGFHGVSDSNGQVTLSLPDGAYRFRADLDGTQFWSGDQNDPPDGDTCTVPDCTSDTVRVTIPVTVTVSDTAGAAKSGLNVYAFDESTYTGYHQTTDSNGEATFTLPQGDYRFRADLNETQFWSDTQNDCTLPGCTSDAITVTMPVTVTVSDTDGSPKADLDVYAFDGTTYTGYHAVTDSNGAATFTLPQGDYRFRADLSGTQFWSDTQNDPPDGDTCTLPGCTSDTVTVTIPITVAVVDGNGTAYPNLPVYAFDGTTYTGFHGTTDANGQLTLTLPQGGYHFRTDLNGTQFWSSTENGCTLPGCTSANVTLPGSTLQAVTIGYTYDPLQRLTSAEYSNGSSYYYTYDSVGNRLTQTSLIGGQQTTDTYQYDIANRLTNVDGVNYAWDPNGNLLNDGVNTYTYDAADRLTSVLGPSSSAAYGYNGLGDRLAQNGTQYTLDLNAGLTQVLDDGTNKYLYGVDRIAQSPISNPQSEIGYFLGDALGSVRQLVNGEGQVTLTESYDPFGNTVASSGSGTTPYSFTGEIGDATGLIYLRARMYDPYLNQFIQPDSIVPDPSQPADWNKYTYVRDNPVNFTDPSGHNSDTGTSLLDRRDLTDWLPRAAVYMATDPAIQEIRRLNSSPNADQRFLALDKFYNLVHAGARFDVKIKIEERLGRSIKLGEHWYEYSLSGNFVYGFYGSEAGFKPHVLHTGAGLAQLWDLLHWLWIAGAQCDFPDVGGPQHDFDTPDDYTAVDFGIWSYERYFEPTGSFTEANLLEGLDSYPNAWGLHRVLDPGDYQPNNTGPYAPDYFDQ